MKSVQFFLLADVAGHGDDFTLIILFEPGDDDGRIQSARVSQNHFLDHGVFLDSQPVCVIPAKAGIQCTR